MQNCIFCQIVRNEIPSKKVYEDETLLAFRDLHPQAPIHILIIPKKHFSTLNEAANETELLGKILSLAAKIAREQALAENGFRFVINTNQQGGQSVYHLHAHILGGSQLGPSMVG